MPYKKTSRIDLGFDLEKFEKKSKPSLFFKRTYDWDKLLPPEILKRNRWLGKVWSEIYKQNPKDDFIRKLTTDDMIKTKWFEKYGYNEPEFF